MLQPYSGPWNFEQAAHLLRRTTYGPNRERIQQALDEGLAGTFDTLFSAPPAVDPPVYYDFDGDPNAGIGETWVGQPFTEVSPDLFFARFKTIFNWWMQRINRDNQTITERLTMFWHNHFVIDGDALPNHTWNYLSLLRELALGNFREMTKRVTIDQAMLVFLNGTQNFKDAPNENYARELLELFTIGKGPLAGDGDYTNYTEQDVQEISRALTGWFAWNEPLGTAGSIFVPILHDIGTKQLSHRFDNQVINNAGEQEYANVIDIIFQKDEVSRHICRRLYMWFVYYKITPEIEAEVIEPMAQILRDNDYEIRPALEALLRSEHFFNAEMYGCMIKNPFEYFYSVMNGWDVATPPDWVEENEMWLIFYYELQQLGMSPFDLPSVAGWPAYHQAPGYYRTWINGATLVLRTELLVKINGIINFVSDGLQGISLLNQVNATANPSDVNAMIEELCLYLFPRPMTQAQRDGFKGVLLGGLPDFEWTVEYNLYLSNPNDPMVLETINTKLIRMFVVMITSAEFQLM